MRLSLIDIGVGRWNGEIEVKDDATPDEIASAIQHEADKRLLSSEVSATFDINTGEGNVYAGAHCVGKVKIVSPDEPDRAKR